MLSRLISLAGLVAILSIPFLLLRSHVFSSRFQLPLVSSQSEPGSVTEWFLRAPYTGSWQGWWSPHGRSWSHWFGQHGLGGGWNQNGWNVLYHVGGNGPWIELRDGASSHEVGPPRGCTVEQVHLMSRHHERFPTKHAGARIMSMVRRLKHLDKLPTGPLSFVRDWEYITEDPASHHEQLTTTGPFAGVLAAFTTGVKLRTRYAHLLSSETTRADAPARRTTLWASDSQRVIATAQHFAAGFFGLDALAVNSTSKSPARLVVIPETSNLGADTLTPGDTCRRYRSDEVRGHDLGAHKLAEWRSEYLPPIVRRLQRAAGGLPHLTIEDVYAMQELCGFEITVRGASPWCALFSPDEWDGFEYARDLQHFYRSGAGNKYGPAMGWLWLNATTDLLRRDVNEPGNGPFFASFVHDGDIVPMLAALELFPVDLSIGSGEMGSRRLDRHRRWRASQIVPMGARVTFEKLVCDTEAIDASASAAKAPAGFDYYDLLNGEDDEDDDDEDDEDGDRRVDEALRDPKPPLLQKRSPVDEPAGAAAASSSSPSATTKRSRFVRINVNDGIVGLPGCDSGPGHSCGLDEFVATVKRRGSEVGVFEKVCGLPYQRDGSRGRITFLRQGG